MSLLVLLEAFILGPLVLSLRMGMEVGGEKTPGFGDLRKTFENCDGKGLFYFILRPT